MSDEEVTKDKAIKNIEEYLGEPFLEDFPENTLRIRRNLIIAAFLTLVYKLGNLSIKEGTSLLGVKFSGLSSGLIDTVLLILLAYLLTHFFVNSWSQFWEWKLRLTGMWKAVDFLTISPVSLSEMGNDPNHDSPNNAKQSTLYSWVINVLCKSHETKSAEVTKRTTDRYLAQFESSKFVSGSGIEGIQTNLDKMNEHLEKKITNGLELDIRLNRFHKSFFQFQFFQLFRLFVLEWGLPIALGFWAVGVLLLK